MPNRLQTHKQKKGNTDVSSTPVQGMFQSRPFEAPSSEADSSQQPLDLKTSLMRAERYGHSLSQMNFTEHQSASTAVQPKTLMGDKLPHVVQQQKGLVPVAQGKATPINTDPKLEKEAGVLGTKAAQGEQAQGAGVGSGLQGKATAIQLRPVSPKNRGKKGKKNFGGILNKIRKPIGGSSNKVTKKRPNKKNDRRKIALGATPGKKTPQGQEVLERWHGKNKARWIGQGDPSYKNQKDGSGNPLWEVNVKNKKGAREWKPLDKNIHMGHKLAAVDYWEKGAQPHIASSPSRKQQKYSSRYENFLQPGHKAAPKFKSKIHRDFMRSSSNYRFEYGPVNSSDGAKMKEGYNSLPAGETKWPKDKSK